MDLIGNYIGGEIVGPAADARLLDNIEPATGKIYGKLVDSTAADLEAAVAAAESALPD